MAEYSVTCSWQISNLGSLLKAIHVVEENVIGFDLLDVITPDSCLHVEKENEDCDNLEILFTPSKDHEIIKIEVISEARHIEIYSKHEEYVTTTDSVPIETELEDFAAYRNETTLSKPLTFCKLKCLSLRQSNSMWLYGISFHTQKVTNYRLASSQTGSVQISEIVGKLQKDGLKMSDGAKKLADLLQTYNSPTRNIPEYFSTFANMISNVSQPKTNIESKPDDKSVKETGEYDANSSNQTILRSDQFTLYKQLMESSLKQLEDKLWEKLRNHLELQEQRYMKKLDKILNHLSLNE